MSVSATAVDRIPAPSPPPLRQLQDFVGRTVSSLGARYLADQSSAVAQMARLRRAVADAPGADPGTWSVVLQDFPERLVGRTDDANRYEQAAHSAICLFAVHQQARSANMHLALSGGLGRAVRRLGSGTPSEEATLRRFRALATASSYRETMHHLRGLISQLRAESIPLNYAQLAVDLAQLQTPGDADRVRLRWGRDYHRQARNESGASSTVEDKSTTAATLPA